MENTPRPRSVLSDFERSIARTASATTPLELESRFAMGCLSLVDEVLERLAGEGQALEAELRAARALILDARRRGRREIERRRQKTA